MASDQMTASFTVHFPVTEPQVQVANPSILSASIYILHTAQMSLTKCPSHFSRLILSPLSLGCIF